MFVSCLQTYRGPSPLPSVNITDTRASTRRKGTMMDVSNGWVGFFVLSCFALLIVVAWFSPFISEGKQSVVGTL